ncbi:MAG TPA: type II toxin-antitoxin system RelE/ParE family toxin [Caldisericia bacterium]|nr:type II toxin-antitoxin system RelE/ParE family toxin [Caldisericia bacterium]
MSEYSIFILRRAQKELSQLSTDVYEDICCAVRNLANNPLPNGCLKLSGREGYRIRVGKYRIIYEIDEGQKRGTILHIGHRRDIYL